MPSDTIRLFGIASELSLEVTGWYDTREGAEAAIRAVGDDDPHVADALRVAEFEIEFSQN